jgi:4-hydroxybenzoate polyprenyltransferase
MVCNLDLFQDKVEDVLLGIKSTAIKFGENTKLWLSGFSAMMVSGLLATGVQCQQTWPYYMSVGVVAAHLGSQVNQRHFLFPIQSN